MFVSFVWVVRSKNCADFVLVGQLLRGFVKVENRNIFCCSFLLKGKHFQQVRQTRRDWVLWNTKLHILKMRQKFIFVIFQREDIQTVWQTQCFLWVEEHVHYANEDAALTIRMQTWASSIHKLSMRACDEDYAQIWCMYYERIHVG